MAKNTRHHRDVDVEYTNYARKISKYDIDRQQVDLQTLRREKEKDRTENVKIKNEIIEQEIEHKKKLEVE